MDDVPQSPKRRQCLAAFGVGFLGLPDKVNGWVLGAIPAVRETLDAPRCLAAQRGWAEFSRARFKPSAGGTTGGLRCTPPAGPVLTGPRLDDALVVLSGLGGVVQRIGQDGREAWRARMTQPRGVQVSGPYVLAGTRDSIVWLNKNTGALAGVTKFDWPVNGFWLNGAMLAVSFRIQGRGAVRVYRLRGFDAVEMHQVTEELNYPRGVYLDAGALYVSDTYGHRVLRYAVRANGRPALAASAPSFYPNSVRPGRNTLLVAEEHINQIVALDLTTLARRPAAAGCWSHGQTVVALDSLLERVNEHTADGESVCLARAPLGYELLAPNDAVQATGALYVADTDNQRIVMYKGGQPIAMLTNFNEPLNVDIIA